MNGDGYNDLVALVPRESVAFQLYVFRGGASGISTTSDTPIAVRATGYGQSVSAVGDMNRDGFDDVVVSDPGLSLFVYRGSSSGWARRSR
ncbi:MAG: VCBS repeat-containing protein [Polyangiales bacterium]